MKKVVSIFIVFILLISCSSPTESTENLISVTKMGNQLKITNNSNQTVYFFAVEQGTASLINWAPHFDDQKIIKNSSTIINYSEIYSGSEEQLKAVDKVIVYYWDDTEKTNPKIYSTVVEL